MEMTTPRLLIIDDQPDSIELLLAYLDDFKLDIIVAADAVEGFSKAVSEKPDIIFLDVVMPGVDGIKLCKRLKLNPITVGIPVIFLSGRVELHDKLSGFYAGAIDYITKPYSEAEVVARLTAHLAMVKRLPSRSGIDLPVLNNGGDNEGSADKIIEKTLKYLQDNLAAPPGVVELAHKVGTNERKLTEIFRDRLGMTVFEYHCQLRIELACRMLTETDMLIKQIAEKCGYKNAGDFTRAFRRKMGVKPLEYRITKGMASAQ